MKEKMKEKNLKNENLKNALVATSCSDINCPFHGRLKTRGRVFEGMVKKKFPRRIVLEFERMIYIRKYERYLKSKTKLHARLSSCMENQIGVGDIIQIKECRPLSKIIHFVVIKKIKDKEEFKGKKLGGIKK